MSRLFSGQPAAGVRVALLGADGQELGGAAATTDADGVARFAGAEAARFAVATRDDELALVGLDNYWSNEGYWWGWWDRGPYRPSLPEFAGQTTDALTPMGAGMDDLDGDGRLDLVVTTGTGPQALLRGLGDGTFEDRGGFQAYVRPPGPGYPEFPWSVAFPDLDHDGS